MIVKDKLVSDALAYLAQDPHPIAVARKAVVDAENAAKLSYASAFLDAEGSVGAREATATCDGDYHLAKGVESDAILDLERHRARVKAAEMIIEVWRSENANARAAERVR